jgi:two-component sensor histidine kinase
VNDPSKAYENQMPFLMRESNHRAKNMLSLVQAIARQTAAGRLYRAL